MASLTAYKKLDLLSYGAGALDSAIFNKDGLVVKSGNHEQQFKGFTLSDNNRITGGLIRAIEYYDDGELTLSIDPQLEFLEFTDLVPYIENGRLYDYMTDILLKGNDTITGSDFDDVLTGFDGSDLIKGGKGDDVIYGDSDDRSLEGGSGDDIFFANGAKMVDGGEGDDLLVVRHLPSQYSYNQTSLTWDGGSTGLSSVEAIVFGAYMGETYIVDVNPVDLIGPGGINGGVSGVHTIMNNLSDLYLAYFGRAPDAEGLTYWFKQIYTFTLTFDETAKSFADQEEYKALYSGTANNLEFIQLIYQNLLSREPDTGGLAYWKAELDSGMAKDSFVWSVINGALADSGGTDDRALLLNKREVSLYYAEQSSIHSDEGFENSINTVLKSVNADNSTVESARKVIDYAFDEDSITLTGIVNNQLLWDSFWN